MIKLNIQLFGGRGAFSSLSGRTSNNGMLENRKGKPSKQLDVSHMAGFPINDIAEFESYIRMANERVEYGYIIDKNGKMVAGAKGTSGSVGIAYDNQEGTTVTHNHPGSYGGTFSDGDINHLTMAKLKSIRAVAKEGTYSMKATKRANPIGLNKALAKDLKNIHIKARINANNATSKVTNKRKAKIVERKAYTDTVSDWYKTNAKKYGYTYSFKPNKDFKI